MTRLVVEAGLLREMRWSWKCWYEAGLVGWWELSEHQSRNFLMSDL